MSDVAMRSVWTIVLGLALSACPKAGAPTIDLHEVEGRPGSTCEGCISLPLLDIGRKVQVAREPTLIIEREEILDADMYLAPSVSGSEGATVWNVRLVLTEQKAEAVSGLLATDLERRVAVVVGGEVFDILTIADSGEPLFVDGFADRADVDRFLGKLRISAEKQPPVREQEVEELQQELREELGIDELESDRVLRENVQLLRELQERSKEESPATILRELDPLLREDAAQKEEAARR